MEKIEMAKDFSYEGLLDYSKIPDERVAIFDIDGTISDTSWRVHLVREKPRNYDLFHAGIEKDLPIIPTILFLEDTSEHSHIFFVTGRPEKCRDMTIDWLNKYIDISHHQYTLLMRQDLDHSPDFIVKRKILHEIQRAGYSPRFAVEDRKQVKQMYVKEGIFVFDVNQHDEVF
jgi:hypothetical protein